MKYTDKDLDLAVKNNIFTQEQKDNFITFIKEQDTESNPLQKFLFYTGSLIIISGMTWLLGTCWADMDYAALLTISMVYFVVFTLAGIGVTQKLKITLGGNLLFCIAIAVVPMIVYSILNLSDVWSGDKYGDFYIWIRGKWIVLELSTIAVALLFLIKVRFHFIVFLISFCLWYLSMDIVPVIYRENWISWFQRAHISKIFGTLMIATGYILHLKKKRDFAFWLYLFGLFTLTFGFSFFYNADSSGFFILLLIHIVMCFVSLFLEEPVFMVFGAIGIGEFLSRMAYELFKGSKLFPFALTIIGALIITVGIIYQKNRSNIQNAISKLIPECVINLRPKV
ncbi:MAG: hypothetical protein K6E51_12290 [Treponema sp.]|nr:hypothetical protein [Treponema sp.]